MDISAAAPPVPVKKKRGALSWLVGCLVGIAILCIPLAGYLIYRAAYMKTITVPSGSMEPTIMHGAFLFVDRMPYVKGDPERGDIALFAYPQDPKLQYMKRVIGIPGDTVEIKDGNLFVNGKQLTEPYAAEPCYGDFGPLKIPQGEYFVLGDNRNHSSDSRVWGNVPRGMFIGRVVVK